MESREIRKKFLEFFEGKSHKIVPSAPMVVKDDPTLMFTNAGMNQFKDFFLGTKTPTALRVADTQKCLRVSGKHNDLEEVGIDTYHHTMFEMLGNWSFGDYFKKEAIEWAWELLTDVYGLPKDRLYATVFGGDKGDGLADDNEARTYWKEYLPDKRIMDGSKKDNFWEMGETGPCGPCSEIHIDLRSDEEIARVPGNDLVNQDHPQVVEVWNLVFIQFNRQSDGELHELPQKHVDTGMGFERLAMAIQKKNSNYDTDVFQPTIKALEEIAGIKYGDNEKTDIALRVIVDHIRAISFSIADGQLPSNTGAGYVIRRILRRAVRYGFQFLELKTPFLGKLLPSLQAQFEGVFPELNDQIDFIEKVITQEESSFLHTLEQGLKRLNSIISDLKKNNEQVIPGEVSFELYDTFGFPLDLTSLIARERGFSIDEKGFNQEMAKQKSRSKQDASKETGDWVVLSDETEIEFVGYEHLNAESRILRYRTIKQKGKELIQLVLDKTPFYAESGGQVGDTGKLLSDGEEILVLDTKKENDLIVHNVNKLPSSPENTFQAIVDGPKRLLTVNNHSATHLMHAALRTVLGTHVEQRGSMVNDQLLRFDFSHFAKMTPEELTRVENMVNARIRGNIEIEEKRNVPIEEAKAQGAMALFGEKYGESVRMIIFNREYSVELCGGTHVPSTGQIGLFKIISESSISAGVRRIEAVTGARAEGYVQQSEEILVELKELLKYPKDLKKAINTLVDEKNSADKELEKLKKQQVGGLIDELAGNAENINGISVILQKVDVPDAAGLKQLGFDLKKKLPSLFAVLTAEIKGKPQIAVAISDNIVNEYDLHAGNIVRELAANIKGGGGGQPYFATAGGGDASGLPKVLEEARNYIP
ncbi:MAG: alanine--tRNA ligase [Bacteroidota bacterium]